MADELMPVPAAGACELRWITLFLTVILVIHLPLIDTVACDMTLRCLLYNLYVQFVLKWD